MKKRILLTGAGGRLGSYLRKPLSKICTELVSTDIKKNIGKLNKNEKYISADLANFDQICEITKDVSFVCHFGALVECIKEQKHYDQRPLIELTAFMAYQSALQRIWPECILINVG